MMKFVQDRKFALLLLVVILVALLAHVLPAPRTIDDAFITFRYSRNLVTGQGFVYNPGLQTLGTTTPLYTLLMAVFSTLAGGHDFPWYALTVNALAAAGTATLLSLLFYRVTRIRWLSAVIGLLWGLSPVSVTFAVGGMETSVNTLWLLAATWCFVTNRRLLMGLFIGLGLLTRIDALIWIGPLLLYQLGEHGWHKRDKPLLERAPWRTWLVAGLTILPWMMFALAYFGSPIPNSIAAKSVAYVLPDNVALIAFIRAYVVPFSEFQLLGSMGVMILTVVYLIFTISGLIYLYRQHPRLLPFVIFPWLQMAVFAIVNPLVFRWYVAPPLPALMLTLLVGAWSIMNRLREAIGLRWLSPLLLAGLSLLWISTSLAGWTLEPDHGPQRPAPEMAWHRIELYYEDIGRRLRDEFQVTSETPVASADIGAIGYFSGATIIDTVGLVTPAMSAYYPVDPALIVDGQTYAIPPQLIYDTAPDYLVTMEAFVRLGLATEARFRADFNLVSVILTDFYGTGMHLYRAVE